ncbi:hypothetical protein BDF19DRAFT_101426 [Syncephalis fuscata]|nr:hypothetical protein BDF19DRAFT_101426 [Syncephalis fuscata]
MGHRSSSAWRNDVPDFLMEATGHTDEQRLRLTGIQIQLVFSVMLFFIFLYNIIVTTKMVLSRPYSIFSWCCLMLAINGMIYSITPILFLIGYDFGCRALAWWSGFLISLGVILNSMILLLKVNLVLYQKKWVTYIGIIFILPQSGFAFILIYCCFFTLEAKIGCSIYYPPSFLWYWVGVNMPINVFFSAVFCRIALKQYYMFGSDAWKRLAQDGIQTICLALAINLACCIAIISCVGSANRDMLFPADW